MSRVLTIIAIVLHIALLPLLAQASEPKPCVPYLSASSGSNSSTLDIGNLCSNGTLSYHCVITILDPSSVSEFSLQATVLNEALSVLPLCRVIYSGLSNVSGGAQIRQDGTLDPCWSPSNFSGWSIAFTSDLLSQQGVMWNFTIGQSTPLTLNVTNTLSDLFAVNHTYIVDLQSIEHRHHSVELNLLLNGPDGAFLPQIIISASPCAALSHTTTKYLFSNDSTDQLRSAFISGLDSKIYYLTLTRDMRVAFPAGGLTLTPLASGNGTPLRPFFEQYWFIGSIAVALLVVVMLVVTRAAVAEPYQDYANLKI